MNKVFCIGYGKTGTTTVERCLRILGFNPHVGWSPRFCHYWHGNGLNPNFIIKEIKRDKSFSDFPMWYCNLYKDLDKAFPNSKFILTIRNSEKWFESMVKWHKVGNRVNWYHHLEKKDETKNGISKVDAFRKIHEQMFGTNEPDIRLVKDQLIENFERRNREIIEYFADRNDLLVMDLADNEGWDPLCNFLDVRVPNKPMPWLNKQGS